MMRLYTRTGDDGTTGLYKKGRVSKADPIIEALGDLDELNAVLGCCDWPLTLLIQPWLIRIGSLLAGAEGKVDPDEVVWMELQIDAIDDALPPIRTFIQPKGMLHLARAVCRRLERRLVALPALPEGVLPYINRLSDLLFAAGREAMEK